MLPADPQPATARTSPAVERTDPAVEKAILVEPEAPELRSSTQELPRVLTALRHRDFRYLWAGNFLSNIGTWMQNIAQGWLVLQLTNSAFWLGVVSFAAAAPLLVFTVIGGVIADRMDRRRLLMMTQVAMMVSALLLAVLTWTERITVTHIILLAFVSGVAASLSAPAQQALVPQLVPRADLTNAIGINSAQFNLSRVIGPTVGGFAMELFGMAGNFFLNGLSFLAVIIALRNMHCPATSPI
ncbi:MAG: MFS transporter, partial [Acidobacteriales bacterium]|nr:MFS transporter [Terriglobales bacterium]